MPSMQEYRLKGIQKIADLPDGVSDGCPPLSDDKSAITYSISDFFAVVKGEKQNTERESQRGVPEGLLPMPQALYLVVVYHKCRRLSIPSKKILAVHVRISHRVMVGSFKERCPRISPWLMHIV